MSVEEKFNIRNIELQQKILSEIEKVKKVKRGKSEKNILQLQTILKELQDSIEQKNGFGISSNYN